MATEALQIIGGLIALANAARKILREQPFHDGTPETVCRALRRVYFHPDGILSLLTEIERGEMPSADRIEDALIKFNDQEWAIEEALSDLSFATLRNQLGLSLKHAEAVSGLAYGKTSLRQSIQAEVNRYGQPGQRPNLSKVKALIAKIKELNKSIVELDDEIGSRSRS